MAEDNDNVPLEEKLILDETAEVRPKTKEELARQVEMDARAKKLIFLKSSGKITNDEATLVITDESHGFCNAIKHYLIEHDNVVFASYKKEFGVDPSVFINTDGKVSALDALLDATTRLEADLEALGVQARDALKKAK